MPPSLLLINQMLRSLPYSICCQRSSYDTAAFGVTQSWASPFDSNYVAYYNGIPICIPVAFVMAAEVD